MICSKVFKLVLTCLSSWGVEDIEKDFIDVFGAISCANYGRARNGWSFDWTDQKVWI